MSFIGSASGTVGCGVNDWEYQGGGVTSAANWEYSFVSFELGWGDDFFIYGIDFADDMDGDGKAEVIVARGYPNIPLTAPVLYVVEDGDATAIGDDGPSYGLPIAYSLKQNYPNPFNPVTQIAYVLPKASTITLEVYNVLGQKVRTLINNEQRQMGTYRVQWDALNNNGQKMSSGVYFYRIQADGFVQSKKMILIR